MTDFFFSTSRTLWLQPTHSLWLIPIAYVVAFLFRIRESNRTRLATSLALLLHIGLWASYVLISSQTAPLFSTGWGLLVLVLVASPHLLDRTEHLPEWANTSLFLATLTSLFWVFVTISQIPSPAWSRTIAISWFLTFTGAGFVLAHCMVVWQLGNRLPPAPPTTEQLLLLQRTQLFAPLCLTVSLGLLLFSGWQLSLSHLSALFLSFIGYTFILIPSLVPDPSESGTVSLRLSPALLLWAKIAGILTLLWLFFHLIFVA